MKNFRLWADRKIINGRQNIFNQVPGDPDQIFRQGRVRDGNFSAKVRLRIFRAVLPAAESIFLDRDLIRGAVQEMQHAGGRLFRLRGRVPLIREVVHPVMKGRRAFLGVGG